jgi:hypothetical protein
MPPTAHDVTTAVRELHSQRSMLDGYGMPSPYCVECRQAWPCATVIVIDQFESIEPAATIPEEPF